MTHATHLMTTTTPALRSWTRGRDRLRARRETRHHHRRLQRDLATYSTQAQVDDLLEMLRVQEGRDADTIRDILARNRQAQVQRALPLFWVG